MKRTEVQTKSGLTGWQARLQSEYNLFSEFESFDEMYGLAGRLGFASAREAWEANPIVQGSTNPSDYCRVVETKDQPVRVRVVVELEIDSPCLDGESDADQLLPMWMIRDAAETAIENAVKMGNDHGFTHDHESNVCISVASVDVAADNS